MTLSDDKKGGGTPGEDEPKVPRPPGSNDPEPDFPDDDDELRDLVKPVTP